MKDNLKLALIFILLPWIITALGLLIAHYGEAIDKYLETIVKAIVL